MGADTPKEGVCSLGFKLRKRKKDYGGQASVAGRTEEGRTSEQNDGINDSISCPFRHGRDDVDGVAHRDDSNYEYVIWIGADDDSDATLESLSYCTIE